MLNLRSFRGIKRINFKLDILNNDIPANGLHKNVSDGLKIPYLSNYKEARRSSFRSFNIKEQLLEITRGFFFNSNCTKKFLRILQCSLPPWYWFTIYNFNSLSFMLPLWKESWRLLCSLFFTAENFDWRLSSLELSIKSSSHRKESYSQLSQRKSIGNELLALVHRIQTGRKF